MSGFRVFRNSPSRAVAVPDIFIDEFMADANDAQLKIYLYLLRNLGLNTGLDISDIADKFNFTEKDVERALSYWEKRGLIAIEREDKLVTGIEFLDIYKKEVISVVGHPEKEQKYIKPSYSPDYIKEYKSKADTAELIFVVEQYLGKTLTPSEIKTLIFFTDELNFSPELIDCLFDYCLSRDKKDFRYIEKVAISWAEQGISTPAQAIEASGRYTKTVYDVMKLLGKSSSPTKVEVDYIMRWTKDMDFSMDIIAEACRRTVDSTDSHRFKYADAILSYWHDKKVHKKTDIDELERTHTEGERKKSGTTTSGDAKVPQYRRFEQRKYDFDKLEKELFVN